MPTLKNKHAVITGAAQGIGRAIAERFLQAGADVLLTDLDPETGQEAAAALGCPFLKLDVREEADWQRLAEAVRETDIVVNNAGITGLESGAAHDPLHTSLDDWRAVHATNLDGAFLGCRYAIGAMSERGTGSIINIASRSGVVGIPAAAAYASSKAAIRNHTKSVALYCASQGWQIRCNAILPAAVLTPMWEPMLGEGADREERLAALAADTPLKRFADPAEVAAIAELLASDACTYMTGTELHVDGGLLAGSAASPAPADDKP